jgi:hypothetical protein
MRVLVLAMVVVGCSGKAAVDGSCTGPDAVVESDGGVSVVVMGWSCTSTSFDASRFLPSCTTQNEQGGGCQQMVDTEDPNKPSTGPAPECLSCASGSATDWVCGSHGWEAAGVLSCRQ